MSRSAPRIARFELGAFNESEMFGEAAPAVSASRMKNPEWATPILYMPPTCARSDALS